MAITRRRTRDDARQVLDQAIAELARCQREGTSAVYVADVLALLGAGPPATQAPPPPDPQADPITGCAPVTAAPP
jgi:hypothetical protein